MRGAALTHSIEDLKFLLCLQDIDLQKKEERHTFLNVNNRLDGLENGLLFDDFQNNYRLKRYLHLVDNICPYSLAPT